MKNFDCIELTVNEKEFLNGYAPADSMFTSLEEINIIGENLSLKGSENLTGVRNAVVDYYSELCDKEDRNSDKWWNLHAAMQSVTAVIDHFMITNGRPDLIF